MRDEFTKSTIEALAKRAGNICSNPECGIPTFGAAPGHDGFINVGVAGHITAAAPGGPRYDPTLTREQRRHQSNGVWLCQTHGKLVDSDEEHFKVEMLRKWKQAAEDQSFRAIVAPYVVRDERIELVTLGAADRKRIENVGLPEQDDLESVARRLASAAKADLNAFKGTPGWPRHAIELNLRMTTGESVRAFHASALAEAIQTFNELVVIAPPGTGKTTTLLQVVEGVLAQGKAVAAFIPLGEWSSQSDSLLQSVVRRHAFDGEREEHLKLLAQSGRLVLVMDGWNELDTASRKRAAGQIRSLQREFPDIGIVISTRRQALDVPVSGPVVEIDTLTEGQQTEIARALRGSQGAPILDHAWRTQGVRELVAIPLYLTALLAHIPGETLPTTKEEVLRLFVAEHEREVAKAEALRETILGYHPEMLTALAIEGIKTVNTTISNNLACLAVKRVEDHLIAEGQMTTGPQPTAVLDVLVSHHLLVRSAAETGAGISFQHQQFQEWYASFEVEQLMRAAAAGNSSGMQKLKADVLNLRVWEEPILFACERASRADQAGSKAVAAAVLETMAIDPMLAAEMIYRSSVAVWDLIKDKIIAYVGRWHVSGKVDRAVRFMITTGRSEFASQIWPLISDVNNQEHLAALRAARRFRPSVLGADVEARLAALSEMLREHILSEIAMAGGMEGIELTTRLAIADASPKVKFSAVEALLFRRADRFAVEVLRTAPDEVWNLLAHKGYIEEITDADAVARLVRERQRYVESETDPFRKLSALLDAGQNGASVGREVAVLIEDAGFPVNDQHAAWSIDKAHKLYPNELNSALVHRLEAGREIPFRTENLLRTGNMAIDEGPLVDLVLQPTTPPKVAGAAACIVGHRTVGKLIDKLVAIDTELRTSDSPDPLKREEHRRLRNWVCRAGVTSFMEAVLSRSSTKPSEIGLLTDLLACHGREPDRAPLQVGDDLRQNMIDAVVRWADILLSSPEATRGQFANVAMAIERLPAPELVPVLLRLLAADLARWKTARDEFMAAHAKGLRIHSDAHLQYRRAFSAIGGAEVVEAMKGYLSDGGYYGFGFDAACVLKDIWDREQNVPKDKWLMPAPDFSEVTARRTERRSQQGAAKSSQYGDAIFAVIRDFIKPGSSSLRKKAGSQRNPQPALSRSEGGRILNCLGYG